MSLRLAYSTLLIALSVVAAMPRTGAAEVTTDEPGAIIVFPKVASDDNQETIIQVTNATGARIFARCFYLNGSTDPTTGEPLWLLTDFQIKLTRLQPTIWLAGEGMPAVPPDRPLDLYPGPIPPVGVGFLGELRCFVVNDSESPLSRNALTGEATIIDRVTHSTRKYQALTVQGLSGNDGDNTLLLNNVEYDTCPRVLLLNHFFDDAPDPVLGASVQSSLTMVPCSMDLEHTVPGTATVQFEVFNEFEQRLSASLALTCFASVDLSEIDSKTQRERSIFNFAQQGTLVGQTRIRPVFDAHTDHGHGILAIAEEFRDQRETGSGLNLHFIGGNLQSDVIILPSNF
jgi:hypothetical protein